MSREARVSDSGCGIVLTAAELRTLGVEPDMAGSIEYSITESGINIAPTVGEDET